MEQVIMNKQTRSILLNTCGLILLMLTANFASQVCGQTTAGTGQGTASGPSQTSNANPGDMDAGSLNKLLDMAEKDVGQLSQVNVTGKTGSLALDQPVSTVERQESTVGKTPAAVFVVTNEMIRRSGATTIPEVLRMVPGVQVAQISSDEWAVSARGFNSEFANKLLVQIDGRTVYDLTASGVYWDVQQLLLEDVERIEVIRGPGATIWGANAVNGVINILTKKAQDTQGLLVQGGAGNHELGYTNTRAGGRIGQDLYYRVYGQWFDRNHSPEGGMSTNDAWSQERGGFRMDYDASQSDAMTLQGDCYTGYSGLKFPYPTPTRPFVGNNNADHVSGENILYRWKHTRDEDSDWTFQTYYNRTQRHALEANTISTVDRDLMDFDFQHRFPLGERNGIIWGWGYRFTQDSFPPPSFQVRFNPEKRFDNYFNYFLQDQITLEEDRWYLTGGSKFEHNPYSNFEYQPTVRLLWTPSNRHSIWGAVSRAVVIPNRMETDSWARWPPLTTSPLPTFVIVNGNPGILSEELLAYELGVRVQATERFSWDLALFYNQYDNILGLSSGKPYFEPPFYIDVPQYIQNVARGETYGAELATNYTVNERWRLQCAYTYLRMFLHANPGTYMLMSPSESPVNELYVQSSWDLGDHWKFDLTGRYVDSTTGGSPNLSLFVPSYITMDTRLAWHNAKNLEVAVVGRNLARGYFTEFSAGTLVGPEVYGQVTWRY
jgi:iron complex outermembrane recepter protein